MFILAPRLVAFAQPVPPIKLRSYDHAHVGDQTMEKAKRRVSFIVQQAGIRAEWVADGEPQLRILVIEQMSAVITSSGEVFGFTPKDPDGTSSGIAYVAYASIQALVQNPEPGRPRLDPADLLGYCIAHEIGHLLLPPGSHSPSGIMRARWRGDDFKLIATGRLLFTAEQAKLIRQAAALLLQPH